MAITKHNGYICPRGPKDGHHFPKVINVGSSPTEDTMQELNEIGQDNLSKLVTLLKARLSSSGKQKTVDASGNATYIDTDIFGNEMLVSFLTLSLSEFNQTPYFSFFTFEDTKLIELVTDLLVEGATLNALASRALLERGREFKMNDAGVTFDPPNVSELLQTQYATLLTHHWNKLRNVKESILDFIKQA